MAKILLVWELGNGLGYAGRLRRIGRQLKARGHDVGYALYDLVNTAHLFADEGDPVWQAPVIKGHVPPGRRFVPGGFADILGCDRFAEPDLTSWFCKTWEQLFTSFGADLVIGEYAPMSALAAYGRIPFIWIGNGYLLPPMQQEWFPKFRDVPDFVPQEIILDGINAAQDARGAPVADNLTDYFRGQDRMLYVLPEMDPYQALREDDCLGPMTPAPVLMQPPQDKPRMHVYLSTEHAQWKRLVEGIAKTGLPGSMYLSGEVPSDLGGKLEARGITLHHEPPDLATKIQESNIVVHHGGIDTTQETLMAGRSQVMFPRYVEQSLNGQAIARLNAGQVVGDAPSTEAVRRTVLSAIFDHRLAHDAMKYAEQLRPRLNMLGATDMIVDRVEAHLAA